MEKLSLTKISYKDLNARQKEQYLFQKLSAVLSDYGYATMKLIDDWQGADFIAQHCNGFGFLRVQLKSRFTIDKKYVGKALHIAFPLNLATNDWCVFPHDEIVSVLEARGIYTKSESWTRHGGYSVAGVSSQVLELLARYRLIAAQAPI